MFALGRKYDTGIFLSPTKETCFLYLYTCYLDEDYVSRYARNFVLYKLFHCTVGPMDRLSCVLSMALPSFILSSKISASAPAYLQHHPFTLPPLDPPQRAAHAWQVLNLTPYLVSDGFSVYLGQYNRRHLLRGACHVHFSDSHRPDDDSSSSNHLSINHLLHLNALRLILRIKHRKRKKSSITCIIYLLEWYYII